MSNPVGSICHLEIFATDVEVSGKFYQDLFGWKITMLDNGWMLWDDPAGLGGDFVTSGTPIPKSTTFYISVDDIPTALERVVKLGGIVVQEKTDIGHDYGFYALILDPAGNHIGLWSKE